MSGPKCGACSTEIQPGEEIICAACLLRQVRRAEARSGEAAPNGNAQANYERAVQRVTLMASGSPTWDLSPADLTCLKVVLDALQAMTDAQSLRSADAKVSPEERARIVEKISAVDRMVKDHEAEVANWKRRALRAEAEVDRLDDQCRERTKIAPTPLRLDGEVGTSAVSAADVPAGLEETHARGDVPGTGATHPSEAGGAGALPGGAGDPARTDAGLDREHRGRAPASDAALGSAPREGARVDATEAAGVVTPNASTPSAQYDVFGCPRCPYRGVFSDGSTQCGKAEGHSGQHYSNIDRWPLPTLDEQINSQADGNVRASERGVVPSSSEPLRGVSDVAVLMGRARDEGFDEGYQAAVAALRFDYDRLLSVSRKLVDLLRHDRFDLVRIEALGELAKLVDAATPFTPVPSPEKR